MDRYQHVMGVLEREPAALALRHMAAYMDGGLPQLGRHVAGRWPSGDGEFVWAMLDEIRVETSKFRGAYADAAWDLALRSYADRIGKPRIGMGGAPFIGEGI